MSLFLVPLAVFVGVVLIVGITHVARICSLELQVHQNLHAKVMEHRRKVQELDLELARIKRAG